MKTPTIQKLFERCQSVLSKNDTPFSYSSLEYHSLLLDTLLTIQCVSLKHLDVGVDIEKAMGLQC